MALFIILYRFTPIFLLLALGTTQAFVRYGQTYGRRGRRNIVDNPKEELHYAIHPESAGRLALLEQYLTIAISEIVQQVSGTTDETKIICEESLKKYLAGYEEDAQSLQGITGVLKTKVVAENPLLSFKMIRRIYVTLFDEAFHLCHEKWIEREVKNLFREMELTPPKKQDYQDTLLGILRIHFVYGFKAEEIQQGIFNDIHTNVSLGFEDCWALADAATSNKWQVLAYQWTQAALSISPETVTAEIAWAQLMSLAKVDTLEELHAKLGNKVQKSFGDGDNGISYDYDFYAPCRGETEGKKKESYHVCTLAGFDWDPYFTISPVKLEVLSRYPLVWQVYEFVGESEMNYIKRTAGGSLKRTMKKVKSKKIYSSERSSTNAFVERKGEQSPLVARLNKRIERFTDLEITKANTSQLQLVMYSSLGGHCDLHYDVTIDSYHPTFKKNSGHRIATFLMFLSDVTLGGYTAFPKLKLHVKPVKGSAVFWYSFMSNSKPDWRTLHGGCPVVLGHKIVANRWMMEYENMWKYYCV